MSREKSYQPGKFRHYSERYALHDGHEGARDFEVSQGHTAKVGGTYDPNQRRGPHSGKGPKNYRRRDEKILEDINDRLCDNPYIDASEIDVSISEGNIVLSGSVENRESKRLAEDIAESVSGVNEVENRLRVVVRGI